MKPQSRIGCFLLVSLAALCAGPAPHSAAQPVRPSKDKPAVQNVKGLFALSNQTRPLPDSVYRHPDLTGVSLRASWDDVQPREQDFIGVFDEEIGRARRAGKQVMLSVDPGERTPAWVYEAGARPFAFRDENTYRRSNGRTLQIPIPWDPVFLRQWRAFIQALGKQYGANDSVVLVHMVGPTKHGGEMHLPRSKADKENWIKAGYSKEKLTDAWRTVIDAYAAAFPKQALALDVAIPIYDDDGAAEAILAYAFEKLGRRLHVQHNALAAKTVATFKPHRWVGSYRGKATVGFQLLCPVTPRGKFNDEGRRFGGSLEDGLHIGREAGAAYFEIYPIDLENEALAKVLRGVAQELRK